MEDHAFNRLSFVDGKVYGKYDKQNAGKKNPRHYQKNFDHRKIISGALTKIQLLSNMVSGGLGLFNFTISRLIEVLSLKVIYFAPLFILL